MTRSTPSKTPPKTRPADARQPFIAHLLELRRRLFFVAVSVTLWGGAAYAVEHSIVAYLLRPAHGEKFIYTSVGGGINFLFQVCLYIGLAMSLPVIIYQVLRYLEPLIGRHASRFIFSTSAISAVLALAGMAFGYFLGLPAALQFLLHQFHTSEITALITIQSYLSFVIIYLFGSSLMFQVPLLLYIINRFLPIRLRTLFKYERWVVVVSLVAAALINPSPRIYDLGVIAVPMMMSYQVGILIVWLSNRGLTRDQLRILRQRDNAIRAERQARLQTIEYLWEQSDLAISLAPLPSASITPRPLAKAAYHTTEANQQIDLPKPTVPLRAKMAAPPRRGQYVDGFVDMHRPKRRHVA